MTHNPELTLHQQIQDAKANLRHGSAKAVIKARVFLINNGWTPTRVIDYETTPHLTPYSVRIKRAHAQASRIVSIPALNATDAHLTAAIMYPDWIILKTSRDA